MARLLQIYAATVNWRKQVIAAFGSGPLATDATSGFFYVPSCPGTPTGTPEDKPGFAPLVVDDTNDKLYFYSNGTWRDAGP